LDLSDPRQPQELSALAIEGAPRLLVPHGSTLISVGDSASAEKPQRLSLFDITDLSKLSELSHADFGPKPRTLDNADQHQALQVTPPQAGAPGHIYFPVAGVPTEDGCSVVGAGIQGFSWLGDQLLTLGLANV